MNNYYIYILTNKSNRVLYTGVTNNLERRLWEHKSRIIPGFTKKYNLTKLVYYESCFDIKAAIAREKQIKGWLRKKKDILINGMNPDWADLSANWQKDPSVATLLQDDRIKDRL